MSNGFKWKYTLLWALWALWKIEQYPQALPIIIDLYKDKNNGELTRTTAILFLSNFKTNKDIVRTLIEAIHEEDSMVSFYAVEAIEKIFITDNAVIFAINQIKANRGSAKNIRAEGVENLHQILKKRLGNIST